MFKVDTKFDLSIKNKNTLESKCKIPGYRQGKGIDAFLLCADRTMAELSLASILEPFGRSCLSSKKMYFIVLVCAVFTFLYLFSCIDTLELLRQPALKVSVI